MIFVKIISALFITAILFIASFCGYSVLIEGYNPIDPYIDTQFPNGFDLKKLSEIKIGETKEKVISIIGEPLDTQVTKSSAPSTQLIYSNDGRCLEKSNKRDYDDFAWYSISVFLDNTNKVSRIVTYWAYD